MIYGCAIYITITDSFEYLNLTVSYVFDTVVPSLELIVDFLSTITRR